MKHSIKVLFSTLMLTSSLSHATGTPLYKDASQPVDTRVNDLIKRMTLEEKVAQLETIWHQRRDMENKAMAFLPNKAKTIMPLGIGEIARPSEFKTPYQTALFNNAAQQWLKEHTRLGIPALMHEEALHGYTAYDATSFPQAIALASTWSPNTLKKVYAIAAAEMRATGSQEALAPILDVARDARWGRIEETMGEDPYLISAMGVAAVDGFQGPQGAFNAIPKNKVIATLKHLTGHGQPTAGVNIAPARIGQRELREIFLTPFEAAVKVAGVGAIMASYNEIDGVPSHANKPLLTGIVRDQWGFKGMLVSDYFAIHELITRHGLFGTDAKAAQAALEAGVDVEMPDPKAFPYLIGLVRSGAVPMAYIDRAVKRVLAAKFHLGLFEHPFVDASKADELVGNPRHHDFARQVAEKAMVLLKNDGILPLDANKLKRVAVIGPHADETLLGGYSSIPRETVTILQGIKDKLRGKATVHFAKGTLITKPITDLSAMAKHAQTSSMKRWTTNRIELASDEDRKGLQQQAVKLARHSDVVILVLGENEGVSREAWGDNHLGDRDNINLLGKQQQLAHAILATGTPVVMVLTNGRPLALGDLNQKMPAIIEGWYLGQQTGRAVANILFGDANPSGKLPLTFPRNVGQIPTFYNHKPSAKRGYAFADISPEYAFGHGLSYSTFKYSDIKIDASDAKANGHVTISFNLTNTSKRDGDEVVQLYIHDPVATVTRPVKQLAGFKRVSLKAGQQAHVRFDMPVNLLAFYDRDMHYVVEPGAIKVMIGSGSDDIRLKDSFTITGNSTDVSQHKAFFTKAAVRF